MPAYYADSHYDWTPQPARMWGYTSSLSSPFGLHFLLDRLMHIAASRYLRSGMHIGAPLLLLGPKIPFSLRRTRPGNGCQPRACHKQGCEGAHWASTRTSFFHLRDNSKLVVQRVWQVPSTGQA